MLASGKQIVVIADDDSELATFLGTSCQRLRAARLAELPALLAALARRATPDDGRAARLQLARQLNLPSALACFERAIAGGAVTASRGEPVVPGAETREH